jgi:hypothetical protein
MILLLMLSTWYVQLASLFVLKILDDEHLAVIVGVQFNLRYCVASSYLVFVADCMILCLSKQ